MKISKIQFYVLSFTWGILYTATGLLAALVLIILGFKPKRWGWCWYFEIGRKNWGGAEWGLIFLTDKSESARIRNHEFGHAIQNCFFGPFMPIIVSIPSSCRYWTRRVIESTGRVPKKAYDDIWFEGQATKMGSEKMRQLSEAGESV